jgi:hypothetical protein
MVHDNLAGRGHSAEIRSQTLEQVSKTIRAEKDSTQRSRRGAKKRREGKIIEGKIMGRRRGTVAAQGILLKMRDAYR